MQGGAPPRIFLREIERKTGGVGAKNAITKARDLGRRLPPSIALRGTTTAYYSTTFPSVVVF